jgi:hypothetical protein
LLKKNDDPVEFFFRAYDTYARRRGKEKEAGKGTNGREPQSTTLTQDFLGHQAAAFSFFFLFFFFLVFFRLLIINFINFQKNK